MDDATTVQTPAFVRKTVGTLLGLLAVGLLLGIPQPARIPTATIETLSLLAVALAVYGALIYPAMVSLPVAALLLLGLGWGWAARQSAWLTVELISFGLLLGAVSWQRRRWAQQVQHLAQKVEDLKEQRAAAEQALTLATQSQEALRKKLDRYTQLQTIAEELSNLTSLEAIARLAVDRAFELIGKSDVCLLFLLDPERQELSLFASKKRESLPVVRAKHGDQFDRYVLRTHRPLLVADVRKDFRFTATAAAERQIASVIGCPLLLGQRPEGVLRLDSASAGAYTQDDLRFLDILLDLVATAVMNAKLFSEAQRLAMTDGLTGLLLRRPFLEGLSRELTRAARSREPVSVLMIDVDHFKAYNDTFGHTAGDVVLRSVAGILREAVPPGGMAARYGGEEFAVLLPRTSRLQAGDVAERVRQLVGQSSPGEGRKPLQPVSTPPRVGAVTVSIGVATSPDDAQAELELIRIADQRLYQAKAGGRNMVCSS